MGPHVPHRWCLDGARSNHPACQHQVGWQRGGGRVERAEGGALRPTVAGEVWCKKRKISPGNSSGWRMPESVRIMLPQDTYLPLPLQEVLRQQESLGMWSAARFAQSLG